MCRFVLVSKITRQSAERGLGWVSDRDRIAAMLSTRPPPPLVSIGPVINIFNFYFFAFFLLVECFFAFFFLKKTAICFNSIFLKKYYL